MSATTNKTAFFHSEKCLWHSTAGLFSLIFPTGGWVQPPAGAGLAESPESKRRVVSLLEVSNLKGTVDIVDAAPANEAELLRVHPKSYLDKFKAVSDAGGGELGPYAPFGRGSYEIAALSAGLAVQAVRDVIGKRYDNAYVMSRPPGHHCLADTPMGFCLFANASIAAEAAIAEHAHINKVAIVDWDVHHGNGTQDIFYTRDDVLTISLHQDGCFPPGYSGIEDRGAGVGEGYNVNIPLVPGGGHDAYIYAFERIVTPALERFQPDLIMVASGLDANVVDPLARMLAYSATFAELTQKVMALAARFCEGRLVMVHEGGYAESIVPFCAQAIMETLCGQPSDVVDPGLDMWQAWQPREHATKLQRELIDAMAREYQLA